MPTTALAASGIGNLSKLLKRLEAATSRLEDITLAQAAAQSAAPPPPAALASTAAVPPPPPPPPPAVAAAAPAAPQPAEELPPTVEAWDENVQPKVAEFDKLSASIGGVVAEQAKLIVAAFAAQRHLVHLAAASRKPAGTSAATGPGPEFVKLLEPLQKPLIAAGELRDKNRSQKDAFNLLSAVAEGAGACGWVAVEPKPAPYVTSMKESAQFYTNRVLKDSRDSPDKTQGNWARAFIAILDALAAYVKEHHTTGLSWNPRGGEASAFAASGAAAGPAAAAGGPPPPPPPPPAAAAAAGGAAAPAAAGGMEALFSQLQQGEGITAGLKKVDKSEMTHKNPALRGSAPVPSKSAATASAPAPAVKAKKPPKMELEGNKWAIEHQEDRRDLIVENTEINQTVTLFGCRNCVVQVRGKVNAVSMVSCHKTSLLLDTLVSSLEITASPSFAVQITGRTPTILLDSCDSGQVYLSATGLDADIVTSKCSAINVSVPREGAEEGEMREVALPEQLRHSLKGGKLSTEVVAHTG